MGAVAQLKAMVGMDSSRYVAGARQIKKTTSGIQHKFGAVAKAAATLFSVAMIRRAGREIIRWASDLSIAARNLGIATEEMIALNRHALGFGLTAQDATRIMSRLQTEIHKAAKEGGTAAEKFAAIGLSVHDLIRLDPVQQLQEVARAAANSGLPLENLAEIFGERLGPRAVAMLKELAEDGLGDVSREAGRLADQAEVMGTRWATAMDSMKQKTLEFLNTLDTWYQKYYRFTETLFRTHDIGLAVSAPATVDAQREAQLDKMQEEREHAQKQRQEELVKLYEMQQTEAMQRVRDQAAQDIERLSQRASRASHRMTAQAAAFGDARAFMQIGSQQTEIQLARETQQIQRRMEQELAEIKGAVSEINRSAKR